MLLWFLSIHLLRGLFIIKWVIKISPVKTYYDNFATLASFEVPRVGFRVSYSWNANKKQKNKKQKFLLYQFKLVSRLILVKGFFQTGWVYRQEPDVSTLTSLELIAESVDFWVNL